MQAQLIQDERPRWIRALEDGTDLFPLVRDRRARWTRSIALSGIFAHLLLWVVFVVSLHELEFEHYRRRSAHYLAVVSFLELVVGEE